MTEDSTISEMAGNKVIPPEIQVAPTIGVPVHGVGELSPSGADQLQPFHTEFASFHEEYVRHYIALGDTKAGFSFSIASAVLFYFFSDDKMRTLLLAPQWTANYSVLVLAMALLLLSSLYSFLVIAPQLTSPSREGVVYFGSVAKKPSAVSYVSAISKLSEAQMAELRIKHCYDVSKVCETKYRRLKAATWLGLPGLIAALSALLSL